MVKPTILTPLGVLQQQPKKYKLAERRKEEPAIFGMYQPEMFIAKKPNTRQPLEYMLCTYIRRGKDYPYNSEKRGWHTTE